MNQKGIEGNDRHLAPVIISPVRTPLAGKFPQAAGFRAQLSKPAAAAKGNR
jgi:hypothetical protein